jgi:uncharacterized metal-binding protein
VYACSGCSSAAQLANHLAIRLDRLGIAEMSCVAGLGGDVEPIIRIARRGGRPLVALDGCPLHCVRGCLARHGLAPALHVTLTDRGVTKRQHMDFDVAQADQLLDELRSQISALSSPSADDDGTVHVHA